MQQAGLFLDRDGVVNEERNYVYREQHFRFRPGIFELARLAAQQQIPIIVITNQSGIARGLYNHLHVNKLHSFMQAQFQEAGAPLSAVYYCPHHPNYGACLCRKPQTLLFERALAHFGLVPAQCIMLGDADRDLAPAARLGLRTVKIGTTAPGDWDAAFGDVAQSLPYLRNFFARTAVPV
jgi:D-glycero-D-manno-heptose 1,7-bisphosphate phosphatase